MITIINPQEECPNGQQRPPNRITRPAGIKLNYRVILVCFEEDSKCLPKYRPNNSWRGASEHADDLRIELRSLFASAQIWCCFRNHNIPWFMLPYTEKFYGRLDIWWSEGLNLVECCSATHPRTSLPSVPTGSISWHLRRGFYAYTSHYLSRKLPFSTIKNR